MSELSVQLTQVDKSDLAPLKTIIQSGFSKLMDVRSEFNDGNMQAWHESAIKGRSHAFAIRVSKQLPDKVGRNWLVGVAGIYDIDWVSRVGRVFFLMVDKDGHQSTFQSHEASSSAMNKLLHYGFSEIGLRKLYTTFSDNNDISKSLIAQGFISEGVRKESIFLNGMMHDEHVYSLLSDDFMRQ